MIELNLTDKILRKNHLRKMISILLLLIIMFFLSIYSIKLGVIKFTVKEIIKSLSIDSSSDINVQIIKNIRIPRMLTGMFAGMNLAVAGVLLQGVLKNPMASPNIIGVNAGAGLTAISLMVLFPFKIEFLSFSAFLGAFLTALLIYSLSYLSGNKSINIILAGVAVSSLFTSMTSGIMILNSDDLNITYNWLIGSFSGKGWTEFKSLYLYSILGLISAFSISPKLNFFILSEDMVEAMGISIKKYRFLIIIIASGLAGSAVSVSGTLGFIGLIAPHIGRMLVGNNYKYLVPTTALFGGVLVVISDTLARIIFAPYELPVGIIISLLGAPFFLYLLFSNNKSR